jgi:hypothetical protein
MGGGGIGRGGIGGVGIGAGGIRGGGVSGGGVGGGGVEVSVAEVSEEVASEEDASEEGIGGGGIRGGGIGGGGMGGGGMVRGGVRVVQRARMGHGRALTSVATPEVSYVSTVFDGASHQYDEKRDPAELCEQNKACRSGTTRSANMPGPTCRPAPRNISCNLVLLP